MDHIQRLNDFGAAHPLDAPQLFVVVIDDAPSKHGAFEAEHFHDVPRLKMPLDDLDAHLQQAVAAAHERLFGPGIDPEGAERCRHEPEPLFFTYSEWRVVSKYVPLPLPATACRKSPRESTLPTKTGTPPRMAILAASTLERIPPVPTEEPSSSGDGVDLFGNFLDMIEPDRIRMFARISRYTGRPYR